MYDRKSFALVREVSVADGAVTISSVYVVCRTRRRRKAAFHYRCHRAQEGDQETRWPPPICFGMLAYVQFYSIYV